MARMQPISETLPDFQLPPLVEVVLGIQFDPLEDLRAAQVGALWQSRFREEFATIEEGQPLEPVIERFRPPSALTIRLAVPVPRFILINSAGTELIQIQQDRFSRNWRLGKDPYPRYPRLRQAFLDSLAKFQHFLRQENLGEIEPIQCDITYVNLIDMEASGPSLAEVLTVLDYESRGEFLSEPEDARLALRFVIPDPASGLPIGRLHVSAEPRVRLADGRKMHRLTLTARGAPLGSGPEGTSSFLDLGHEWVVRGFAAITTQKMHQLWGHQCST